MSSELLEKIRNVIETLFALFISILIAWTVFDSLPVHAAENASYAHTYTLITETRTSSSNDYTSRKDIYSTDLQFVLVGSNIFTETQKNYNLYAYIKNDRFPDGAIYSINDSLFNGQFDWDITHYKNGEVTFTFHNDESQKWSSYTESTIKYNDTGVVVTRTIDTNVPMFDTYDHALAFCRTGDTTGLQNGGSIDNPDFEDTAYAFTGFSANNKMTATWTGTTERSFIQDQEVEEYVRVNYYFADKEAQDTIKQADAYPDEFATADKTLTIDVSGLKPDDENWFLRYIRITPCYRQAGLGAWGDFYHGSDVFVYFDVNGKIESIVQNSVPTDGEVIGNNISLIGFRYDTSFHAEFVDVWSNAVNCSAFDLGGSQYLSLGVKALYYNGQSKDIDFVSLDRKNLVWDKTFDSFKTFNGSGIKQLFFTPYIKTGVNNPWNKGNSIVIDFDVNGNATSSFDTGDDGTVHLSDFKLTGVVWNKPMLAYGTITWAGTTANSDMSIVPDSDTLVVCSYPVYDSSLNESYETYDTVTIGKGSIRVYIDSLIDKYTNAGKTWNGEMWLTPCYKKGGVLYMGEPVIVNCTKGTVSDIEVDESTGTANQVDKTDENKSYADAILSSGNNFFSIVKGLIASMQQLPELIATLFSFLPGWVNALIAGSIFVIFVCRILGR